MSQDMFGRIRAAICGVLDPELPVVTIADLGILREVKDDEGVITVTITPTYSGCPAMDAIREDIVEAARAAGADCVEVRTVLSPAWTTEWLSPDARRALAEHGVSPPAPLVRGSSVVVQLSIRCPQCGSLSTEESSRFGSTACTSLHRCRSCGEPFSQMKAI
jgi:ring-1,2-phenylacetyl-CoA epoxidase subunit PaaD